MAIILSLALFANRVLWAVNNIVFGVNKEKKEPQSSLSRQEIQRVVYDMLAPMGLGYLGNVDHIAPNIKLFQAYGKQKNDNLKKIAKRIRVGDYLFVLAIAIIVVGELLDINRAYIFGAAAATAIIPLLLVLLYTRK